MSPQEASKIGLVFGFVINAAVAVTFFGAHGFINIKMIIWGIRRGYKVLQTLTVFWAIALYFVTFILRGTRSYEIVDGLVSGGSMLGIDPGVKHRDWSATEV